MRPFRDVLHRVDHPIEMIFTDVKPILAIALCQVQSDAAHLLGNLRPLFHNHCRDEIPCSVGIDSPDLARPSYTGRWPFGKALEGFELSCCRRRAFKGRPLS